MQRKIIHGSAGKAILFLTDNSENAIESYAEEQIKLLCDNEVSRGSSIRIMPDVHPGKGCTIGLTMTIQERVLPALVGVDIGCGVTIAKLDKYAPDFQKLDKVIASSVPSGFAVRDKPHSLATDFDLNRLKCVKHIQNERALCSLGTLGGGNHFIEVDKGADDTAYLVIHSGSRRLGLEVCTWYLQQGREILQTRGLKIPLEQTWLEGNLYADYMHDIAIIQDFAALNRQIMILEIVKGMKWKVGEVWSSIHNYVDFRRHSPIIRKGAISAYKDEKVLIPINMRDGVILGLGRGNPDWNYSAPHGAGRIGSRTQVKSRFTLSDFKKSMQGIYSSSVNKDTLDEAPFAYRQLGDILDAVKETVDVQAVIQPVYSFKAGGTK